MIELVLWAVSFLSLFLSIFWINVMYSKQKERISAFSEYKISFLVPALNEEKTIARTLQSLINADYPHKEIIVINDGSTDKTSEVVRRFKNVILLQNQHRGTGKASALNKGLAYATGQLIAVVDADSEIDKQALKKMVPYFKIKKIGAVISTIKVKTTKNLYEKLQRIEYILATFSRTLMSKIDTLHVTPGALSMYKTKLIKKLGGFDEHNLTEDLEIAMRLRYYGYNIKIDPGAISYTNVPSTFKSLWKQRVRWFRGFIYNTSKYRKMFMSKKHGIMGTFQIPLNFITLMAILVSVGIVTYGIIIQVYRWILKSIALKTELFNISLNIPSVKEVFLGVNISYLFPVAIALLLSIFILHKAHRNADEKWNISIALLLYFTIYPMLRSLHWLTAFYKESLQTKRKW